MTNPASRVVLDSSAILATILDEPGAEVVRPRLRGAWVSTVNWSEVLQKLAQANVNLDVAREIRGFSIGLVDFDERAAEEAAAPAGADSVAVARDLICATDPRRRTQEFVQVTSESRRVTL